MGLFSKSSYEEKCLNFKCGQLEGDDEAGIINIEAYDCVDGENLYFFASYTFEKIFYQNGTYDKIIDLLKDNENKKIKLTLKVSNNKIKDFKIDLNSLASIYNCDELKELKLFGWGINKKQVLK